LKVPNDVLMKGGFGSCVLRCGPPVILGLTAASAAVVAVGLACDTGASRRDAASRLALLDSRRAPSLPIVPLQDASSRLAQTNAMGRRVKRDWGMGACLDVEGSEFVADDAGDCRDRVNRVMQPARIREHLAPDAGTLPESASRSCGDHDFRAVEVGVRGHN
jgi:hypothetical protein